MINQSAGKTDSNTYIYPRSEEIVIHKSDLQIQLEHFKERIHSSFSIFDLLAIISLWSPVFTADFKKFMGLTSDELKIGYVVFSIMITIFIISSRCKFYILRILRKENLSSDSSKMAEAILRRCQSKPKKV